MDGMVNRKLILSLFVCSFLSAVMVLYPTVASAQKTANILLVGGGASHDFDRWYRQEDAKTIESLHSFQVQYTDHVDSIPFYLKHSDVLILSNNQPIGDEGKKAITRFVEKGNGLLLLHPGLWYNWADWPEYNLNYAGGGSKSHEEYRVFKNCVVNSTHPITKDVPLTFELADELYRYMPDPEARGIEVLAIGMSMHTDEFYPVVFTVKHPKARIAGISLGHDEKSHTRDEYKTLLTNAVRWVSEN